MPTTAIYASRILTPHEEISDSVILVEGSRISAIGHRDEIRIPSGAIDYVAAGMTVVPGFVDIHIHGAGGHDVMEGDAARARPNHIHGRAQRNHVDRSDHCDRAGRRNLPES